MKEELIKAATEVMKRAYAPYSHFCVGAALLAKSGKVYTGCNVENSSYGVTSCAERSALFSAVSSGEREFFAIAVVGGKDGKIKAECPPCGVCLQALGEFCKGDFEIHLYDGKNMKTFTLGELLPKRFEVSDV